MSLVDGDVDLAGLSRGSAEVEPPRPSWLRIVVPLLIVGAFAFVLRDTLLGMLQKRPEVTLVRPVRLEAAPAANEKNAETKSAGPRQLAVQAAGWIEPDPFPTLVPALAGGVVLEVPVRESETLEPGAVVARLVREDAQLAYDEAAASVATARAALELTKVRMTVAAESYEAAIDVTEAAQSASAQQSGREAEVKLRDEAIAEGNALVSLAESEVIVQRELDAAGAAGARQVEIAEAQLEVAKAKLATLKAQAELARSAALTAKAANERAQADLRLRFADRLARDETAAAVAHEEALLASAEARLATAALALERTEVVTTSGGVVLERLVVAGETLNPGQAVCSLFDPASLRVRVDVPQDEIGQVRVGQMAEILADARPGEPYQGEVIRIVEQADIQKVTLEAQVRVVDADGLLRPDMLTQVRFFTDGGDGKESSSPSGSSMAAPQTVGLRVALPRRVIDGDGVWLFDPVESKARRVGVEVGAAVATPDGKSGEWVEIRRGINLTDKVVDGGRGTLAASSDGAAPTAVKVVEDLP